ncbi:MAG: hypothetical protein LBR20_02250 [Propionibacteriaceae bacterium]|jgi:multidrug resistance efflux pump|nr:hypothetical protein [Propionibacteriaceae bacterium]
MSEPSDPAEVQDTVEPEPATGPDYKEIARKQEQRAKENHKRVAELTAELEALRAEVEQLRPVVAERDQLAVERLRFQILRAKGLNDTDMVFITGTTEADITAQVDAILERDRKILENSGPRTPAPNPDQGRAAAAPPPDDLRQWGKKLFGKTD